MADAVQNEAQIVQAKGRCLCGAVAIAVKGKTVRMAQCHCMDCRRASGTGHVSNAIFADADVTVAGETKSFTVTADSGNAYTRFFCPACGSRLYGRHSGRPGMTIVHVGMLDDADWFTPQVVLYARSRPVWDATGEDATGNDVPCFETAPPGVPAR